jgi:hypothetical protein
MVTVHPVCDLAPATPRWGEIYGFGFFFASLEPSSPPYLNLLSDKFFSDNEMYCG